MKTCPKCGYERQASDTAPDWQCPSCGVAYNKVGAAAAAAAATPKPARPSGARLNAPAVDSRERGPVIGQGISISAGGVYFAIVAIGMFLPSDNSWLFALPPLALSSFGYWCGAYRRKLAVAGAPTSKVATASQGYTELSGTVVAAPGGTVQGPLTAATCVWYQYNINEGRGEDRRTVEHGAKGVPFILRDETGDCLVNPHEAELLCDLYEKWEIGDREYCEWSIRIGDPVYAIGKFSTRASQGDLSVMSMEVLREWLSDAKEFFARFDADGDGKISHAELAVARKAARQRAVAKAQEGVHTLVKPDDGRPFIIINKPAEEVGSLFKQWTGVHLCIFLIALAFLGYNLR